ncbi:phosphotransacetylase family protein [Oscillatoria sp. CS-180]|uniref:phosphotransacetylase family protein n=1 Tax=Oscillatoria sp. CS-180 TaxID=3021720 RepID=UPI00232DC3B4|nr:phosphotransacetylase family protein [Oscillatoria sp. CS-180]MDB9525961.1 phosphotransacetylase family protein [Oscillatoria sp. CS-180]
MSKTAKHLIIGSTEACSGKSTLSVAIGSQLQEIGFQVGWGKPLASVDTLGHGLERLDTDLSFVPTTLSLVPDEQPPNLLSLDSRTLLDRLHQESVQTLDDVLKHYWENAQGDILLLEGPSTLDEGALFNLSLPEMATALDAQVLLVMQFDTRSMVDQLVAARKRLGDALLGVVLNSIREEEAGLVSDEIVPYLERQGLPVLATLPKLSFLQGIRVSELVRYLDAEVLCGDDHLDLVVESLKIGAMNVNSALRFFGQGSHQAIVTGGDRRDLQIAALETSTHCLILTGQIPPAKDVLAFAKDKEVPVLSVATDTLTTVEQVDSLFGRVPLNNPDKVSLIKEHLSRDVNVERLITLMGLEMPAIAPHG